jgi:GxxExxY protein
MAFKHENLTEQIIGVCLEVFKELGHGFNESVYHNSLLIALEQAGLNAESQVRFSVLFRGQDVGTYVADIVVESVVIIEVKALVALAKEHQAQLINYLKGTGKEVGLLVNFGTPRMQFKRVEHPDVYGADDQRQPST